VRRLAAFVAAIGVVLVVVLVAADRWAREEGEVWLVEIPFEVGDRSGVSAGRIVFIHEGDAESAKLLAHELVHVCQWESGRREFLWDYSVEYASNLAEYRQHDLAYTEISFEQQARSGEIDCDIEHYDVQHLLTPDRDR
jgi:hypothetical protein